MKKIFKIMLRERSGSCEEQIGKFPLSQLMSNLDTTPGEANLNDRL